MNIEKELVNNQVLLSVFSKDYYNESIFEAMRNLKDKRVCYVTLNKTADSLQKSFKLRKIHTNKIFFIDAVSEGIGKRKERENVIQVSSPAALTELSIAISEVLKSSIFDVVLFDSLSTLKIYGIGNMAEQFTTHTINKIRSENIKGVFTCLEDDVNTNLIKDLFMYVDKVVRFTKFYDSLKKKKDRRRTNLTFASLAVIVMLFSLSFLNFGTITSGTKITGLTVTESASFPNIFLFFIILLLVIGILLIYKKVVLKQIPDKTLLNIKPSKQTNTKNLKRQFKNKLYKWFKKNK